MSGDRPMSQAAWDALLRQGTIPFRAESPPEPTREEIIADQRPLDLFINCNQKELYRILLGLPQHRPKFSKGGIWDETDPVGRAALLDVLTHGGV